MKKTILSFATAIALSFSSQAFAGTGHSHDVSEPVSEKQATQNAAVVKQQLVDSEQVSAAWSNVTVNSAEQRSTSAGNMWVVEYVNPEATDENKTKLFVFLDELGNPVGANHSGKL